MSVPRGEEFPETSEPTHTPCAPEPRTQYEQCEPLLGHRNKQYGARFDPIDHCQGKNKTTNLLGKRETGHL